MNLFVASTAFRVSLWLVLAILLASQLLFSSAALAHASLISSEPAEGSIALTAPEHFKLSFSEPVSPLVMGLIRPDGSRLSLEKFTLKDRELSIETPVGLDHGTHVLTWRVVSEDGHPIGGSIVFAIGTHTAPPSQSPGKTDVTVLTLLWGSKVALYCGLFFGVGGVFAQRWLFHHSSAIKPFLEILTWVGMLSLPILLAAQGLDALGLSLSEIYLPVVWRTGARTTLGPSLLVAAGSFGAALLSIRANHTIGRALSFLGLVGTGTALALTGHASSAYPQLFTRPAVALHGMAVAAWIGALLPLRVALQRQSMDGIPGLQRFSRAIPIVVAVLVVSGLGLAFIQLRSVPDLWLTRYGQVLGVKLGIVTFLLLLAAFNRWRLTQPTAQGIQHSRERIVRIIGVELVVALLLFGTVAVWRFTPPPRSMVSAQQVMVNLHGNRVMVHLVVNPNRAGPVSLHFMLMKETGNILTAKDLSIALSMPSEGIEPIRRQATPGANGQWAIEDLTIPLPGIWAVEVNVLVSEFEAVKLSGELAISR